VTRDGSRTSHYDFDLPVDLIAQQPTERRGDSRLMVVNRSTGEISHRQFNDIVELIPAGDALVINTTKVFRARLLGLRDNGANAEILLLRPLGESMWEAMVHPGGKLKPGRIVKIAEDFDVTPAQVDEFRVFLSQRQIQPSIAEWSGEREFIRNRLKTEIFNQALGVAKGMTGGFGAGFLFFGLLALLGFLGLAMVKVRWRTTWGAASGARV